MHRLQRARKYGLKPRGTIFNGSFSRFLVNLQLPHQTEPNANNTLAVLLRAERCRVARCALRPPTNSSAGIVVTLAGFQIQTSSRLALFRYPLTCNAGQLMVTLCSGLDKAYESPKFLFKRRVTGGLWQ